MFKKNSIIFMLFLCHLGLMKCMGKLPGDQKFKKTAPKVVSEEHDYYNVLGVTQEATVNEINHAYQEKMNNLQENRGKTRPSQFKRLEERLRIAYRIISTRKKSNEKREEKKKA